MKSLLVVVLLLGLAKSDALVCPDKSQVSVINMSFDYLQSDNTLPRLMGARRDREVMNKYLQAQQPGKTLTVTDDSFQSKAALLAKIRKQIEKDQQVVFNYAGHGMLIKRKNDFEFAIPLPNMPQRCVDKIEDVEILGKQGQLYRTMMSRSLQETLERHSMIKTRGASSKKKGVQVYDVTVFKDDDPSCDKYVLTASDLRETFGDRDVSGIIDSCHSGALKGFKRGMNIIYSAQPLELASEDDYGGGMLFNMIGKLVDEKACRLSPQESGVLSMTEVMNRLPPVFLNASGEGPGISSDLEGFYDDARSAIERGLSTDAPDEAGTTENRGVPYSLSMQGQRPGVNRKSIAPTKETQETTKKVTKKASETVGAHGALQFNEACIVAGRFNQADCRSARSKKVGTGKTINKQKSTR